MGVFLDKSIKNVVDGLNVRYFLPDIQREYVWLKKADEKKIEQLFDSILRGYPIGSFFILEITKRGYSQER
ncbi:DUF262 domain-containing protein [Helicobacter pylori]|uniref:DUF262 domain-containing protein n=1 Tax=Helicobacter pylori TaxID=210 RepID=UPI001E54BBFE|nr:DUF262 domain-containing protein [Helicobacter pylori]